MPIVTKRLGIILARVDRGFVLRKKGFSLQLLLTSVKIEKKIALENSTLNSFERKWNPLKDALGLQY